MTEKITFIINPMAGNGRAGAVWRRLTQRNGHLKLRCTLTTGRGHATELAREALKSGQRGVVAVGGDGTINEVVNGFFEDGALINSEACFGFLSAGTGCDWERGIVKTGLKTNSNAIVAILAGQTKKCDVGRILFQSQDGQQLVRYFLNVADAGFGGVLVCNAEKGNKFGGGFVTYLLALLKTLWLYENVEIKIEVDDFYQAERTVNAVIIANGQYFGGGMHVAPNARLDDGLFEIVITGNISRTEAITNLPKLYNGTLACHPKVTAMQGRSVRLFGPETALLEADGECIGKLPATFEILSEQINLIV